MPCSSRILDLPWRYWSGFMACSVPERFCSWKAVILLFRPLKVQQSFLWAGPSLANAKERLKALRSMLKMSVVDFSSGNSTCLDNCSLLGLAIFGGRSLILLWMLYHLANGIFDLIRCVVVVPHTNLIFMGNLTACSCMGGGNQPRQHEFTWTMAWPSWQNWQYLGQLLLAIYEISSTLVSLMPCQNFRPLPHDDKGRVRYRRGGLGRREHQKEHVRVPLGLCPFFALGLAERNIGNPLYLCWSWLRVWPGLFRGMGNVSPWCSWKWEFKLCLCYVLIFDKSDLAELKRVVTDMSLWVNAPVLKGELGVNPLYNAVFGLRAHPCTQSLPKRREHQKEHVRVPLGLCPFFALGLAERNIGNPLYLCWSWLRVWPGLFRGMGNVSPWCSWKWEFKLCLCYVLIFDKSDLAELKRVVTDMSLYILCYSSKYPYCYGYFELYGYPHSPRSSLARRTDRNRVVLNTLRTVWEEAGVFQACNIQQHHPATSKPLSKPFSIDYQALLEIDAHSHNLMPIDTNWN